MLAIFAFFPSAIQEYLFSVVGEDVTEKIRKEVYNKILKLPVRYF